MPSQNIPLWHKDYFELIIVEPYTKVTGVDPCTKVTGQKSPELTEPRGSCCPEPPAPHTRHSKLAIP